RAAISFLPLGILYVLFAPFPWMIRNAWQFAMLPEMVLWWAAVPFLARGYWFAFRKKLRATLPITIFTIVLTLAYALYQTNVGTVHRQRSQIFVFFFIFISIGWELRREAKERRQAQSARRRPSFGSFVEAPGLIAGGR